MRLADSCVYSTANNRIADPRLPEHSAAIRGSRSEFLFRKIRQDIVFEFVGIEVD